MRRALVSDLHANLAAAQAVLADIAQRGIEDVYCLGDVVGYGPDPRAVLALTGTFAGVVMGNHDHAVLHGTEHTFNAVAQRAIDWTDAQLAQPPDLRPRLATFAPYIRLGSDLLVHGSPASNAEYIIDSGAALQALADPVSRAVRRLFTGHSHIAGYFRVRGESCRYYAAEPEKPVTMADDEQLVANAGSVGQPRDGDGRASWLEVDDQQLWYHRVAYAVAATQAKIYAIPELDDALARRLTPKAAAGEAATET